MLNIHGRPLFEKVTIDFPAAKKPLVINAKGAASNQYIKKFSVNGRENPAVTIDYADIANGGEIVFDMTDNAGEAFASSNSGSNSTMVRRLLNRLFGFVVLLMSRGVI